MKIAFLVMCLFCAVMFSMLIISIETGRAPFHPAPKEAVEKPREAAGPALGIWEERTKTVDDLIAALKEERRITDEKSRALAAKEEEAKLLEETMGRLKTELQSMQSKMDQKILEFDAAEKTNLRRLAEVCGKMDSTGAASFLRQMEKNRAAAILSMIPDRSAAAILDAAVAEGEKGVSLAAEWADIMRRIIIAKKEKTGV
jgi:flagellar motility protein MotE (MotC chaperone)